MRSPGIKKRRVLVRRAAAVACCGVMVSLAVADEVQLLAVHKREGPCWRGSGSHSNLEGEGFGCRFGAALREARGRCGTSTDPPSRGSFFRRLPELNSALFASQPLASACARGSAPSRYDFRPRGPMLGAATGPALGSKFRGTSSRRRCEFNFGQQTSENMLASQHVVFRKTSLNPSTPFGPCHGQGSVRKNRKHPERPSSSRMMSRYLR